MKANISEDIESRLGKLSYYSGHHELKELKNKVDSKLKDLREQPVYVMIVGDGNRGKSTLLNALIGQNLAEVSHLPKTWRIDTYTTTNDNEYAELVWEENGKERKEKTTYEKAFATCKDIEKKQKEISKKFEDWKTDLKQVNWFVKSNWNLTGRALVDTPGFSQLRADTSIKAQTIYNASGIQLQREDGFSYYYYRADLVLWCISATKLEDADALDKLKEVHVQNKPIIGIITFMDRISKERWDEIKKRAENVYGKYISKFILSAAGAPDKELKDKTVKEIMAAVDEFTLGKEKYIKHIEAEKFYSHNINELENLIKQIASLFTDNYIQYHKLFDSTLESLSTHENNSTEKISSYVNNKRNSLINSLDSLWNQSNEQPNIFAEEIKSRIPISVCNSEFEKTYRQLTDNFYAVFMVAESTDYKAVKLGQNKAIEIKLDNLNAGSLSLHNANTINISKFDSLRGKAAGQSAKEFFGDNLVGEIFEGIGKLLSSGRIRREKISGAEKYINEIFDDLETQYTEYIENLSVEFSSKIKDYMQSKFKTVNGGDEKAILSRIYDIENTLNTLQLYGDTESVVHNNSLLKSYYVPKIVQNCSYFKKYSAELMNFIDYHMDELYKYNENKISAVFNKLTIDIENNPMIVDFEKLLNIPNTNKGGKKGSSYISVENPMNLFNPNDNWRKNIYWAENNMLMISKLHLLTTTHISHMEQRYGNAVSSLLQYYNKLNDDYSNKWDDKIKREMQYRLKDYEEKLQLEKRFSALKNLVYDSLKKEINYNNIENYFYFQPEKSYYDSIYNSLEYSYFKNSKGESYKFHYGNIARDYVEQNWHSIVNFHKNKVVNLENEYDKKLNQKIIEYIDVKFNEYIKKIDIVEKFNEDIKIFTNKSNEFVNAALSASNSDLYGEEYDNLCDKYYEGIDIDYSFFYPESSKKNIYFKVETIKSYIKDKLDKLIEDKICEIDRIYEETIIKWDLRVYNYCREYYSKLIVNSVNNKNVFNSEHIKNTLFDVIKRQYRMDLWVVNQIESSIGFKSKLINAINFRNILNENEIPEDLAFDLEIKEEILKNYQIFEENMLNYMTQQLYEICRLFFSECNSIKYMIFKGKNSVFVAETLNKLFSSYILDKDGVLL